MDDFSNLLMEFGIDMAESNVSSSESTSAKDESVESIPDFIQESSSESLEEESREGEEVEGENTKQQEESSSSLSDNDIDDIIGAFDIPSPESESDVEENSDEDNYEDSDEEENEEDEFYDENQEEGHDIEQEDTTVSSSDTNETENTATDNSYIPLNSPTLLLDQSTSRFSGAEWYNEIQTKRIIFAGMGGIGSNAAFQIARMAPAAMVLYDDDRVETVNMSGQLFSRNDVGKNKVDAVINMIQSYTSIQQVYGVAEKYTHNSEAGDIMMCGFDNMQARKTFFLSWCNHVLSSQDPSKCLFLDGRLSMTDLQVFCITGDNLYGRKLYLDKYLFDDEDADETVCSMKQTTYLACMIASVMTNLFTNFVANSLNPVIPYDLPFLTEYDAQNMIFKTCN